jgi:GTPase SAR1 family protein
MGCGSSNLSADEKAQLKHSKELNAQMEKQKKDDLKKVKLLLLGAGESGKSTIFKQMKVIYGKNFTSEERKLMLPTIYSNVVLACKVLIEHTDKLGLMDEVKAIDAFKILQETSDNAPIDVALGDIVKEFWNDPGIQKVWDRRSEFQIIESVQYYFERIDKIKSSSYLPDKDDILYSRVRTSGIVTEQYVISGTTFEMYDVGGQRNERKKWIHCFEGVTAIIFVAALSEYDQRLFEDASSNRMMEALDLFESICNNVFFQNASIILFLNKRDLFTSKVEKVSIKDQPPFSDYSGAEKSYDDGVAYFLKKFLDRKHNTDENHTIYHHCTCATDTRNVRVVFDSCKEIIMKENLKDSGFLE